MTNSEEKTISSKELMARTGISRATLNNYISLNIIPSPIIRRPEEPGGPTKIGYFPVWVLERLAKVRELKAGGMRIPEIAAYFAREQEESPESARGALQGAAYQSIEQIVFPAVLVNERWEIIWINRAAEHVLFQEPVHEIASASKRNIIRLLLASGLTSRFANWTEVLRVHFRLAKRELSNEFFEQICRDVAPSHTEQLRNEWLGVTPLQDRPITQQNLVLRSQTSQISEYILFSSDFREGTLLLYSPANMQLDQILNLLMGRERLIKTVLSQRIPSLTPLSILAGRLESTLHLRTALPPYEYFDLVNQVTLMCHQGFQD
jgi:adenylate cyclase